MCCDDVKFLKLIVSISIFFIGSHLSAMQCVNGFDAALLFQGAACGWIKAVESVLADNVSVDLVDSLCKTPLIYALENGHFQIALYLLECGANQLVCDEKGRTTLEILLRTAPQKENDKQVILKVVQGIMFKRADFFQYGKDIFIELARKKNYDSVVALLESFL